MNRRSASRISDVEVVTRGPIPDGARDLARDKVVSLAPLAGAPILHVRIRLTQLTNPAVERPVVAQANLDVNGRVVRAQVAGTSVNEAVDLLQDRLRMRISRQARPWEEYRRPTRVAAGPGGGRADERAVVRRKTYELGFTTPDEAAFDLDLMDYDFQLFTDAETGQDCVVQRDPGGGYRVEQVHPAAGRRWSSAVPLTVSDTPAPRLTQAEAVQRLEALDTEFVFFADADTGRGCVLYRRYDGDYGLVTPA